MGARGAPPRNRRCPVGPRRAGRQVRSGVVDRIADQQAPLDVSHHHGGAGGDLRPGEHRPGEPLLAPGQYRTGLVRAGQLLGHHRRLTHHARDTVQHRRLLCRAVLYAAGRPTRYTRTVSCDRPAERCALRSALYGTAPGHPSGIPWAMRPGPSPVTPLTARKTWRTVEPLHGMVYFAPEAAESYRRLGLEGQSGYFASRSAPMGAVSPGTVVATFYNFRPSLVRQAMDGVWDRVPPVDVLDARRQAAGAALRRMLGPGADSEDVAAAADLAVHAAVRAAERTEGRPLFAGHADLPWPDEPLERLWHAQTLLREFRGDGHIAQLVRHDLDGVEALVLHEATGELPAGLLRQTRGWSDDEWAAAAGSSPVASCR